MIRRFAAMASGLGILLAGVLLILPSHAQDAAGLMDVDVDGDAIVDVVEVAPEGENAGPSPGAVMITSGENGALLVEFMGVKDADQFGYAVHARSDFSGDESVDVAIGAPFFDEGRLYVFHGPFDGTGPQEILADNADMTIVNPSSTNTTQFGRRARGLSDLTGDGVADLLIGSIGPNGDRSFLVSSASGLPIFAFDEATLGFDPWAGPVGDADGDGDVDSADLDVVISILGTAGPVGDFNDDGVVDGFDLAIVVDNEGEYPLATALSNAIITTNCSPPCCYPTNDPMNICACVFPCDGGGGGGGCGNGVCGPDETHESCPLDCLPPGGGGCGDGECGPGESGASCPEDCDSDCGDGECEAGEDCPEDCCGDGNCGPGESGASCPEDCDSDCGDGECETGEECPEDCCGDGNCGPGETGGSCPEDCEPCVPVTPSDTEAIQCMGAVVCFEVDEEAAAECQYTWDITGPNGGWCVVESVSNSECIETALDPHTLPECVKFMEPGEYSVSVTPEACDCNNEPWEITYRVIGADLDIDSDNDGVIQHAEEEKEEEAPGKFVVRNVDDDDEDGITDFSAPPGTPGEDDLVRIALTIETAEGSDYEQWRIVVEPAVFSVDLWDSPTREQEVSPGVLFDWPAPSELFVEGQFNSEVGGDVTLTLEVFGGDLPEECNTDSVVLTVVEGDLRAHRTQAPPMQENVEVPDGLEDVGVDPAKYYGAGVRYNGDDDNGNGIADHLEAPVAGENDLTWISPFSPNDAVVSWPYELVYRRSSPAITAWHSPDKSFEEVFGEEPVAEADPDLDLFVEWTDASVLSASLELGIRNSQSGAMTVLDVVSLYRFQGVVIVIGGRNQAPDDPADPNHGTFQTGIDLHRLGYDVHMWCECDLRGDDIALALDEIRNAVDGRGVQDVAIMGYSWGGGRTYLLCEQLAMNPPNAPFTIQLTSYVDAVDPPLWGPEIRRPPGSTWHLNQYQNAVGDPDDPLNLDGAPIPGSVPPQSGLDVETMPWGLNATHTNMDDMVEVKEFVKNNVKSRMGR